MQKDLSNSKHFRQSDVLQAKTLHVDMAFVLEGKEREHLPEQIAGVIRLQGIDFKDKDGKRLVIPEGNDVTN